MKLAVACLVACGLAAHVQACCADYDGTRYFYSNLHFDQTPPLTASQRSAFVSCLAQGIQDPGQARTSRGKCNFIGCNCDHCYGETDCMGTNDDANHDQNRRIVIKQRSSTQGAVTCYALSFFRVPGYTGYCGAPNPGRRLAQAAVTQAERDCADKDQVINEPLTQTAARLSSFLCDSGDVGLTFAGAVLTSLDADNNGVISCAEWQIAKTEATLAELGGSYLGLAKLPAPLCKLSKMGAGYFARYNEYLGALTLATLKANATGLAVTTAQRAAAAVEAAVVGNAAVGKVLDVTDAVAAKLNVTLP